MENRIHDFQTIADFPCKFELTEAVYGAPNILSTPSRITTKIRRETDMTSTHEDTVFKISKIIFNTSIFAIEVIRTAKIV